MSRETERSVNGIRYYTDLNTGMHRFCLSLYFRAGPLFETEEENGLTHMFEHAVFRNIEHKYGDKLSSVLAKNCLEFNGVTYKEFVYFVIVGAPESFAAAADILFCVFDEIRLSRAELQTEKQRVKAEIRESAEKTSLAFFADARVWKGTPLAAAITGSCANVDSFSAEKLNDFRKRTLTRENVFFYLTGNVSGEGMTYFERKLASLSLPDGLPVRNIAPVPTDFGNREPSVDVKNASFFRIRYSFDVDNAVCPVGVRDVLYTVLFEGELSLVFETLSEESGLIYSYDCTLEQYDNVSVIKLEYDVSKRNLKPSVEKFLSALTMLKNGEFDFDTVLRNKLYWWQVVSDDVTELNWNAAYENHILGGTPVEPERKNAGRYAGLTKRDITAAAEKIFVRRNMTVALKGDKNYISRCGLRELLETL